MRLPFVLGVWICFLSRDAPLTSTVCKLGLRFPWRPSRQSLRLACKYIWFSISVRYIWEKQPIDELCKNREYKAQHSCTQVNTMFRITNQEPKGVVNLKKALANRPQLICWCHHKLAYGTRPKGKPIRRKFYPRNYSTCALAFFIGQRVTCISHSLTLLMLHHLAPFTSEWY